MVKIHYLSGTNLGNVCLTFVYELLYYSHRLSLVFQIIRTVAMSLETAI